MKSLLLLLSFMFFFVLPAHSFEGLDQDVSIGIFNRINCGDGLVCTKVKSKFNVVLSGAKDGDFIGDGTGELYGFKQNQVTASAITITAAQCGSTFVNAAAMEMELPEASAVIGCKLTFIVGNASNFTIDPDAADIIVIATDAAGDKLIADAVGESITIQAISATQWALVGAAYGTWTDSN